MEKKHTISPLKEKEVKKEMVTKEVYKETITISVKDKNGVTTTIDLSNLKKIGILESKVAELKEKNENEKAISTVLRAERNAYSEKNAALLKKIAKLEKDNKALAIGYKNYKKLSNRLLLAFNNMQTVQENIEKTLKEVKEGDENKKPMTSKGLTDNNVCPDTVQAVSDQTSRCLFLQDHSDGKAFSL